MRVSRISISLSLLLMALLFGVGLWLLRREPAGQLPGPELLGPEIEADESSARRSSGTASTAAGEMPTSLPDADAGSTPPPENAALPVAIEGRVTDSSGKGIAAAHVRAVQRLALTAAIEKDAKLLDKAPLAAVRVFQTSIDDVASRSPGCRTDAEGWYAFRGLPEGDHRVVVTHSEFIAHGDGDWIAVAVTKTVRHDIELTAGQVIAGRVQDRLGQPVAGVEVQAIPVEVARLRGLGQLARILIRQDEGTAIVDAKSSPSDARGAFRVTSLAPGLHDLRLLKTGFISGEVLNVGTGVDDLVVTLEPAIRITGRVLASPTEPIASAAITLREPEHDIKGPAGPLALAFEDVDLLGVKDCRATTDDAGRFALAAFSRGSHDLLVSAAGWPELREQITIDSDAVDLGDLVLPAGRTISGTVFSPTGLPVAAAEVWVPKPLKGKEDRDTHRAAVLDAGPVSSLARSQTNEQGGFSLGSLAVDTQEIAVYADGYPGEVLDAPPVQGGQLIVVLKPGLTLRGRVIDTERGEPLAGARVSVEGQSALEVTTSTDGSFELRGIRTPESQSFGTSIDVDARMDGFRDARQTVVFPDPDAARIAQTRFEMRRRGPDETEPRISGRVRDSVGNPMPGVRVWTEVPGWPQLLRRMESGGGPREVRTDDDGTFAVRTPHIGGTVFEVLATAPGLATSRVGPFPQARDGDGWPFIEIVLGEGALVEGRVIGQDGAPIPGAHVRFWRDSQVPPEATMFTLILPPTQGDTVFTALDGSYRQRRLEPGNYYVEARARGHVARTLGPLAIRTGESPQRIDVVLTKGHALTGRVVDLEEKPLGRIEVVAFPIDVTAAKVSDQEDELLSSSALGLSATVTRADGSYEIDHLPEGELRLLARARGFEVASMEVAVPAQAIPDLVLVPHASISGHVRDEVLAVPLSSFSLRLERQNADGNYVEDHRQSREVENAMGYFECEGLRAGEWRLQVLARDYSVWQGTMKLAPGAEQELDVAMIPGCRIEGVVRRPDGTPVPGVAVSARREGEQRDLGTVHTGRNGDFDFSGLEAGNYHLQASHGEYYADAGEGDRKVQVSAATAVNVILVLRPAGKFSSRIEGLVFREPGVDIWIVTFTPVALTPPAASAAFQVWADGNGLVRKDSLRPGRYRLELTHRRQAPDTGGEWITVLTDSRPLGEVEIRAGELARLEGEVE